MTVRISSAKFPEGTIDGDTTYLHLPNLAVAPPTPSFTSLQCSSPLILEVWLPPHTLTKLKSEAISKIEEDQELRQLANRPFKIPGWATFTPPITSDWRA
ncbi:hypothetical protein TNCV_1954641 [Trichonephila clavipes]|nr:hypothetical protein TNCV_1954641 [Trichonephila clavipes]